MKTNTTLAGLLKNSTQTVQNVREDMNDFLIFGYSNKEVENLEELINELNDVTPDSYFTGLLMVNTNKANEIKKRMVLTVAKIIFTLKTSKSKETISSQALSINYYTKSSNSNFVKRINDLLKDISLNEHYTEALGNIIDLIPLLRSDLIALKTLELAATAIIKERRETTVQRNKLSETLKQINSEFCRIGKFLYRNDSPGKYVEYVMNSKSSQISNTGNTVVEPKQNAA